MTEIWGKEAELPTPEQLEEFDQRARSLLSSAKYPHRHGDSMAARYGNCHGSVTVVGLGREIIAFDPNAVDLHIQRVVKEDDEAGHSVERYEYYAYSVDTGKTAYEESVAGFIDGERLRSEDEQRGLELTRENPDEALALVLGPELLRLSEGPLADYIREVKQRRAAASEHNVLTRARMEVALEELRNIDPEDEEEIIIRRMEELLRRFFHDPDSLR